MNNVLLMQVGHARRNVLRHFHAEIPRKLRFFVQNVKRQCAVVNVLRDQVKLEGVFGWESSK